MDTIISGEIIMDLHHVFEMDVKPFHDEKPLPLLYRKIYGVHMHHLHIQGIHGVHHQTGWKIRQGMIIYGDEHEIIMMKMEMDQKSEQIMIGM
jgi:hypothetical protein